MKKSVCLILCICLVLGASAPAFALPISTTVLVDNSRYENYLGGANGLWDYSESTTTNITYPEAGTWAYAMLRQLYTVFKYTYYINSQIVSNSSYQTSNFGKAMYYFSTASFQNQFDSFDSYLDLISTRVNLVNTTLTTYLPDIKSGILSVATHAGTISSMLGFTASNTLKSNIDSVISGISSSNTNTSNIKSVLDNLYGALGYNSAGTLKTAINSIISNTSDISGIKSGTDYIDDIAADTASLPTIENNTSAIKVNSDYLPGISSYASNLPGIKAGTDYLDDIYNAVSSISVPTYDFDNLDWNSGFTYAGVYNGSDTTFVTTQFYSKDVTFVFDGDRSNFAIYKAVLPITFYNASTYDIDFKFYVFNLNNGQRLALQNVIYNTNTASGYLEVFFQIPEGYSWNEIALNVVNYTQSVSNFRINGSVQAQLYYITSDKNDYFTVSDNNFLANILKKLDNVESVISDPINEAAKANNVDNQTTVLNNFTGSGTASATSTDFNDLTSGVSSVKNGLNTGVSLSNLFGIFNNSDGYSWFSSQVLNEINTVQSSTRTRGSNTPLYDQKINEIYSYMGVNNND